MRNAKDSGKNFHMIGNNNNGIPAIRNMICQPISLTNQAPNNADVIPPMAYPLNIIATKVLRIFLGAYSVIKATTFGITPPIPRPAIKRKIANSTGLFANAPINVKPLNKLTQIMIVFLRPNRSESVPKIIAPNIMPNNAALASKPA
jgi:hypothetical protein